MNTNTLQFNTHRVEQPNDKGMAQVTIDKQVFLDITKYGSTVPFKTSKSLNGADVQIYTDIHGYKLITGEKEIIGPNAGTWLSKDGAEHPKTETVCFMNYDEAKALQTNVEDEVKEYNVTI